MSCHFLLEASNRFLNWESGYFLAIRSFMASLYPSKASFLALFAADDLPGSKSSRRLWLFLRYCSTSCFGVVLASVI
jgi:hypothetical protein